MRKVAAMLLCLCVLFTFGVFQVSASEEKFKPEYKMHVNVGENTAWGQAALMFANKVKESTGGKMNIKIYWSAQLIAGKQASESMFIRNGTIDFSLTGTSNFASVVPAMELTNLPFFVSSHKDKFKAYDAVYFGKTGEMLAAETRKKTGIHIIAWTENGFRELHYGGNRAPIIVPGDLKNLKIRYVSSLLYQDIFQGFGANPMVINWNEAIQGFQQGLVDGGENTYPIICNYKIYEFHKQMTEWSYAVPGMFFATNGAMWDAFQPETREMLEKAARESADWLRAVSRVGLDDGWGKKHLESIGKYPPDPSYAPEDPIKFLEEKGVKIHRLTAEEIKPFREMMEPVYEKWIPKIGKEIYEQAKQDMEATEL